MPSHPSLSSGLSMVLCALPFIGACSSGASVSGAPEYHTSVRPVLEASCVTCHHDGGPAPFSLEYKPEDWQDGAPTWAASVVSAVEDGRMPPWLPADDCHDLAYSRVLTDQEKTAFLTWRDNGFPQGDPAAYKAPGPGEVPPDVGDPTLAIQPDDAYVPSTEMSDDYRCFLLPTEIPEETYLFASGVVPGEQSIVHHALLYLIPESSVATIQDLDAADEGPGYTCFGGPGGGALSTIGAWVPGSLVQPLPEGAAFVLPKGSRIVMQIHYNTLNLAGKAPPADRSTANLWTRQEKPKSRIELLPLAHLGMEIPAGEQASVQERVFESPGDVTLVGLAPHMHLLGESISAVLEPASGAEEACLIDVPRWDFHWQQNYGFPIDKQVEMKKGDKVRVTCTYDNSAANQPTVDGVKQMPRDVTWGEGTLDEMCLIYLATMVPYEAPDFRCGAYPACVEKCAEGDGACFFDCATVGGGQCAGCLVQAVGKCAPPYCATTGIELQSCLQACPDQGPGCLTSTCAAELDSFYACMEPHLENGDCTDKLSQCGL